MIRPFTLICMLLACGSGLYLYQTKHRVRMLDRDIAQTVQATTAARDRGGVLRTEWTLLNDLERLRALSDQHLQLRPVASVQFTTLAELANRLPAPRVPEPETPAEIPASLLAQTLAVQDLGQVEPPLPEMADLPTPPRPPPAPRPTPQVQVASAHFTPSQPSASQPSASQIAATQIASHAFATRAARAAVEAGLARAAERRQLAEATPRVTPQQVAALAPRPVAVMAASGMAASGMATSASVSPQAPPQISSLGMARTMMRAPIPVAAYQYSNPN